jgi:hypothetical protein
MARDEVARRLLSAAPTVGPQLVEGLLPAVRYATRREPDAAIDIAQSKIGGAPDLPRGVVWPNWITPEGERRALQFFAQIDLGEAAAASPASLGLPEAGQLSFFADFEPGGEPTSHPGAANILYSPPDSQFFRCALRMAPLPTAHLIALSAWSWAVPPQDVDLAEFEQSYEASLHALAPERYGVTGRHQLGGHVRSNPDRAGDGFVVLQLDSDATLEIAWGRAATDSLLWTLQRGDVAGGQWAAGRFGVLRD